MDDVAALIREARVLVGTPPDDPRRVEYAARKQALLAQVEEML